MDPLLQLLLALALLILAAKGAGYLSRFLGQPAVLGELLAGLLLGPTLFDLLHWPIFEGGHLSEVISSLAHLGVIFLMFIAGLEVDLEAMRRTGRPAAFAGALGVIVPVALAAVAFLPFGFTPRQGLFVGLTMAATSVSISAQTLMELGVLRSRVGMTLLGAAVVDDILVVLLLSFTIALAGGGSNIGTVAWMVFRMVAFLVLAFWLGARYLGPLTRFIDRLPISEGVIAAVIVVTLLYAWAAEALGGVAAITGAFLAGLLYGRTPFRQLIEGKIHTIAYAWLVPIFFISIGIETNARSLGWTGLPLALAILAIAVISKVVGCGIGARLGGLPNQDALRVGVGMISRGEVGLIVASVEMSNGLIDGVIFADTVLMVLATTLITPLLLKALYSTRQGKG